MKKELKSLALVVLMLSAPWTIARADCNRQQGLQVFQTKCAICHTVDKKQGHTFGPNLAGVVGRRVGKAPGYEFSMALGSADTVWDKKSLDYFLKEPAVAYPETAMSFSGLPSQEERSAVVCFLGGK